MKQVVLNLSQPQYTALDKPLPANNGHRRFGTKKLSSVKSQSAAMAARPSVVTFEQAERDENVYKPQPTEFVSLVRLMFLPVLFVGPVLLFWVIKVEYCITSTYLICLQGDAVYIFA